MKNLKVCNLRNPLGIDITPTFSWLPEKMGYYNEQQISYRIYVSSSEKRAKQGIGDLWDSGNVSSDMFTNISYAGLRLKPQTVYYWKVKIVCNSGEQESQVQFFETGIFDSDAWKGHWIGKKRNEKITLEGTNWIKSSFGEKKLCFFRKSFEIKNVQKIDSVLIGIKGRGETSTYFNQREQETLNYQYTGGIFEVTPQIREGKNTVAIASRTKEEVRNEIAVKIILKFKNGSIQTLLSDDTWRVCADRDPNWDSHDFDDSMWNWTDISSPINADSLNEENISLEYCNNRAVTMLRKEFLINKEPKEAMAYVCGLGFFELSLNGNLPDDSVLNPFNTQYNKRVLYRTFDITHLLKNGINTIGIELGNGFYNEIGGVWNWNTAEWRDEPKAIINLVIHYTDGSSETIVTDSDWKITTQGPIVSNSLYYGEIYDARKELNGWNLAGFDESSWALASLVAPPAGKLSSQLKAPVREINSLKPKKVIKIQEGSFIIESPEMVAGWIELKNISENPGSIITISYGQFLTASGKLKLYGGRDGESQSWWPHAYLQQDQYISNGKLNERYKPKFSYKGFQYVQIDGYHGDLTAADVSIKQLSNDIDSVSIFKCSNRLFNELHQMMVRAMRNNFHGDHCDPVLEKNGWTGDANVSLDSLMFNYDMPNSLPAWLTNMDDCYEQYQIVPLIEPTAHWGLEDYIVWNSLYVFGVEYLENYYGLTNYAKNRYDNMKKYTLQHIETFKKNHWICDDRQLGDWVAPMGETNPDAGYNENVSEGSAITGTAMFYKVLDYMITLGTKLNKKEDIEKYCEAKLHIYRAFQDNFYKSDSGLYQTNYWLQIGKRTKYRQTDNLIALAFGLVPEENKNNVVKNLVVDIKNKDYHLDTGCVGTKFILPMLCDLGYPDIAYRIASQTTYPSWGFWKENGSSSTWEMWESTRRSNDHYFLGTYDEWFYSHLAGIRSIRDGYKNFEIKPEFYHEINSVNCKIETVRGELRVDWIRDENGQIKLDIVVPFGSTAKVNLPKKISSLEKIKNQLSSSKLIDSSKLAEEKNSISLTIGSGVLSLHL